VGIEPGREPGRRSRRGPYDPDVPDEGLDEDRPRGERRVIVIDIA
jgi:hypothetical protein